MKVKVGVGELSGAELSSAIDEDLAEFDQFFQEILKNAPLIKCEKAAIKTYLWWKANIQEEDASQAGS